MPESECVHCIDDEISNIDYQDNCDQLIHFIDGTTIRKPRKQKKKLSYTSANTDICIH